MWVAAVGLAAATAWQPTYTARPRPSISHSTARPPYACTAAASAEPAELVEVRAWVERTVIGLNLCPFARPAWSNVRFAITDADVSGLYPALQEEIATLLAPGGPETSLLVAPHAPADYGEFAAFIQQAELVMQMQGVSDQLQVVGFHPGFEYASAPHEPWRPEGEDEDAVDPCNYTNRSPHPMIHLLRQESVRAAVASHPDSRGISLANERLLRRLGLEHMRRLLVGSVAS